MKKTKNKKFKSGDLVICDDKYFGIVVVDNELDNEIVRIYCGFNQKYRIYPYHFSRVVHVSKQ